jgi:hypothetical protein
VKWIGLAVLLAAAISSIPTMRTNTRAVQVGCALLGFLPFVMDSFHLTMGPISWSWTGIVTGVQLTVLDALALSLYFAHRNERYPVPFRLEFAFYLFTTVLSALVAYVPEAALFYSWQVARMIFVYVVVARLCANPLYVSALLKGMGAGLLLQMPVTIWQRFGLGVLQATGTTNHQNELGMISHFVTFPFFALLLSGRAGWLPLVVVPAGVIVELLTVSRATLGLSILGYLVVFVLSAMRKWTSRKAMVLVVAVAMGAAATPVALSAMANRGSNDTEDSDTERSALIDTASMMLSDHPMGIGANNFVAVANQSGYYAKAGVAWLLYDASVHNVYWLVVTETGYLGLVAFITCIFSPIIVAFRSGLRNSDDVRGELLIGIGTALLIVYLHALFEWILVSGAVQYAYFTEIGLLSGLAMQLGYWRKGRAKFHLRYRRQPRNRMDARPSRPRPAAAISESPTREMAMGLAVPCPMPARKSDEGEQERLDSDPACLRMSAECHP